MSRSSPYPAASEEPPTPILRLRTCLIRSLCEGDAESTATQANNPRIAKWMRNAFPHPYRVEDAFKWISIATSTSPIHNYTICRPDDNTAIGGIGLKPQDDTRYRTIQIGYWLGEEYWGRGIATEALSAFSEWTFEHFKHVIRLEAEVYEGNDSSTRVLEKAGYAFEARHRKAVEKKGQIMDLSLYCRFRDGYWVRSHLVRVEHSGIVWWHFQNGNWSVDPQFW